MILFKFARNGCFRGNFFDFGLISPICSATLTEIAANKPRIIQLILDSMWLISDHLSLHSSSDNTKMRHYSDWRGVFINLIVTYLELRSHIYMNLAFVYSFLRSVGRFMIVKWLCYGQFVQSIVLQNSCDSSTARLPVADACATTPVYSFLGHIILGKSVSINDQQMLATLSDHQIKFAVVEYIFGGDLLWRHPHRITWKKSIDKQY